MQTISVPFPGRHEAIGPGLVGFGDWRCYAADIRLRSMQRAA
jgi:hypothetical protein